MKRIFLIIVLSVLAVSTYGREHKGFINLYDYRPLGEYRLWTIIVSDSVVGKYTSTVKEETKIDGDAAVIFEEKLTLNYNKINNPLKMDFLNLLYISQKGYFLGFKMNLDINDTKGGLELFRNGDKLEGKSIRGENEIEESIEFNKNSYAVETNFFDHYELFWASRDFKVGDLIEDSIFVLRSMNYTKILAQVIEFDSKSLYNQLYDSVFVIAYTQPTEQIHYFTPDNKLVKAIVPSQELKAYLDVVRQPAKPSTEQSNTVSLGRVSIAKLLLAYIIYLGFGLLSVIFFIKQGYRWLYSYICLLCGAIIFAFIPFTQIPLQSLIINNIFIPKISQGGSPYLWGILPAAVVGIIQELLKFISLLLVFKLIDFKKYKYPIIGAVLGVGFGLAEAGYIAIASGNPHLISINILERGFTILFHTTAGALLGYSLSKNNKLIISYVIIFTIIVNTIFRYLPLFVQFQAVSFELLTVALALISVVFLLGTTILFKRSSD